MHAKIQTFWLPKAGNMSSDYEDAFWPPKALDHTAPPIRLAVGDGATETSFSALWARMLVRGYGKGYLTAGSLSERLPRLQGLWRRRVSKDPLPWYAEEKMRDGAFSSLVGLTIQADPDAHAASGHWEAFAIG